MKSIYIYFYCKSTDSYQNLKIGLAKGKKDYPEIVISEQVNRALRSEESVEEKDGQHMKKNGVPLVVTDNPNFKNLSF